MSPEQPGLSMGQLWDTEAWHNQGGLRIVVEIIALLSNSLIWDISQERGQKIESQRTL